MKRIIFAIGFLALLPFAGLEGSKAKAEMQDFAVGVGIGHAGFFYESLRPYGEWIEVEQGFYAWRPLRLHNGWRPYLNGRWQWTDYGWYWVSDEPFGWATFHYGRWYMDDYYGWVWVPDDVWGPAWVEWRYNDDYIGWAPLSPYATFNISIGIRYTTRWAAPADYWCFVHYRSFGSARIRGDVVDMNYTRRLIRTTRTAVRYEVDRDRVVNRGVDRTFIERQGNFRINRADVAESRERNERIIREGNRDRIEMYRPSRTELEQRTDRIEARRGERKFSLDLNRVERNRSTETIQRREGEQRTQQRQVKPTPRREANPPTTRRATPENRTRKNEFRSVEPPRSRIERTPTRRDNTPSRESTPKRGRDH